MSGPGDEIVVKFSALHKAADDISTSVRSMNSQLDGLKADLSCGYPGWLATL